MVVNITAYNSQCIGFGVFPKGPCAEGLVPSLALQGTGGPLRVRLGGVVRLVGLCSQRGL